MRGSRRLFGALSVAALLCAAHAPVQAQAPHIGSYAPNPVRAGREVAILGERLGRPLRRELRYGTDGARPLGTIPSENVLSWESTRIRVRLPTTLDPGQYWIAIYTAAGDRLSNQRRELDVQIALESPPPGVRVPVQPQKIEPVGEARAKLPGDIAPPRGSFTCGPHLATYGVRPVGTAYHVGVRCVLFDPDDPDRFAWYGEGVVGSGLRYRHLGLHTLTGGERYDISGNGEAFANATRFALAFGRERVATAHGSIPRRIMDRGGGGEWVLEEDGRVAGFVRHLGPVAECGEHLMRYTARDDVAFLTEPRAGSGIRCAFRGKRVWYGAGDWGGTLYVHLGLKDDESDRAMAADICDPSLSETCGRAAMGAIELGWKCLRGAGPVETVSGAWRERWTYHARSIEERLGERRCIFFRE